MKVIEEKVIQLTPALMSNRTYREPVERPRSKGVHVQSVNRALAIAAGKLDDNGPSPFTETSYPLLPALGVAWEEFRVSHYSDSELAWQPFELEKDSIFGTPDGILFTADDNLMSPLDNTVWECKLTTKKYNPAQKFGALGDCWLYQKQGMCYCAMAGLSRVQYDVCWLMGDYVRPYKPVLTSTVVEFSEEECETWWKRVLAAAPSVQPE